MVRKIESLTSCKAEVDYDCSLLTIVWWKNLSGKTVNQNQSKEESRRYLTMKKVRNWKKLPIKKRRQNDFINFKSDFDTFFKIMGSQNMATTANSKVGKNLHSGSMF